MSIGGLVTQSVLQYIEQNRLYQEVQQPQPQPQQAPDAASK